LTCAERGRPAQLTPNQSNKAGVRNFEENEKSKKFLSHRDGWEGGAVRARMYLGLTMKARTLETVKEGPNAHEERSGTSPNRALGKNYLRAGVLSCALVGRRYRWTDSLTFCSGAELAAVQQEREEIDQIERPFTKHHLGRRLLLPLGVQGHAGGHEEYLVGVGRRKKLFRVQTLCLRLG